MPGFALSPLASFLQPLLGVVILLYVAYVKYSELRFRKTAVVVKGEVKKITPRRNYTVYLFAYTHNGLARLDEYAGPPAMAKFDLGEVVEILIDPSPPRSADAPSSEPQELRPTGVCALKGAPLFGFWDVFWVVASAGLIAHHFMKKA